MLNDGNKGEGPDKRLLPTSVQHSEWLRLSCYSALLYVAGIHVPILGIAIVLGLISPTPISLIGIRQGTYKAFSAVVFVALIFYFPYGVASSASFICISFIGIVFGIIVKKTNSAGEAVFALIIAALVSKLLYMGFMVYTKEINPFEFDENSVNALISSLKASGAADDVLDTIRQRINLLIPSLLIMTAGIDTIANYFLVSRIENRRLSISSSSDPDANELKIHPMPTLDQWSFPRSLLVAFFSAFLISLFNDSNTSVMLISAELNLKILTCILFFIQGLSFVWWWMLYKKFSYGIRLSVLFVLLFIPIFLVGLIFVGLIDIALNLRERIGRLNTK